MSQRSRAERDNMAMIEELLRAAGVTEWTKFKNRSGHTVVEFYRGGKKYRTGFSGSSDVRAIKNNKADLRRLLALSEPNAPEHRIYGRSHY